MAKGVKVFYNEDSTVSIELHIIVENGVNLVAVCSSIMSEVRYVVGGGAADGQAHIRAGVPVGHREYVQVVDGLLLGVQGYGTEH